MQTRWRHVRSVGNKLAPALVRNRQRQREHLAGVQIRDVKQLIHLTRQRPRALLQRRGLEGVPHVRQLAVLTLGAPFAAANSEDARKRRSNLVEPAVVAEALEHSSDL
jgi:hypothetical protein